MNSILVVGTATVLILAFALQLNAIAEDASDKALTMSNDMNNAIDCAIQGLPIEQCSPNLVGDYGFEQDAQNTIDTIQQFQEDLEKNIDKTNSVTGLAIDQ